MMINESTWSLSFSIPIWACSFLILPSKPNGVVTIPTVRIFISLAIFAITGAAPVPVPPPIPAVINTIFVFTFNIDMISSELSSAAFSPTSGFAPAPNPSVRFTPNCILFGTPLLFKACASVLHITKSTPFIPCLYIWLIALLPPPPTPMALITFDWFLGKSKLIPKSKFSSMVQF